MIRLLLLKCLLLLSVVSMARTIVVKNIDELNKASKSAQPGDIIILQNGVWKDVIIKLNVTGTIEKPITFKAQTAGKVLLTGHSQLKLGGAFIIAEGLYFTNGYAGDEPVIGFRINKDQLANNCRVTNCVISDFNNPKRMDENNWVLFYGKNNRLDNCSFKGKTNMGVLLAVIMDDERSRESFHSIDHNYFGKRIPLASNGGEIIRVGVSQHCQFKSNTLITYNFFEHCDGEAEIISIKSCNNTIQDNIFKECQGALVLRHGDDNIVSGNIFLGNDKPGTGGVRVINKGQVVKTNVFYKCRGANFRSPLTIMNGIPNSPAHRYVQVTDAEITANTFYECSPLSFCEGSDTERTLPPDRVTFANNIFYNTRDSVIYIASDDIHGINLSSNIVSKDVRQTFDTGFEKIIMPTATHINMIPVVEKQAYLVLGAAWFPKSSPTKKAQPLRVNCKTAEEVYMQLERKEDVVIQLTGKDYFLTRPFLITKNVRCYGGTNTPIAIHTKTMPGAFVIAGNGNLSLEKIGFDGSNVGATHFICNDTAGSSAHYNLSVRHCTLQGFDSANGCEDLFYASKSMVADSIILRNNYFLYNNCNTLMMLDEKDDKGYYNAENILIGHNIFYSQKGVLLAIYRGGNDESTMGPGLMFSHNKINSCDTKDASPLIHLTGVQLTNVFSNSFSNNNTSGVLILYTDKVRASHIFEKNVVTRSGSIDKNNFVLLSDNTIN